MAYDPNAQEPSRPVDTDPVSTLTLELRRMKALLVELKGYQTILQNATIPGINTDFAQLIADVEADMAAIIAASFGKFTLLTGSGNFVVPAGASDLLILQVGAGMGGWGGYGCFGNYPNNTPNGSRTNVEARGPNGQNGEYLVTKRAVVAGQTLAYVCGTGSAGTAASTYNNTNANYSNIMRAGVTLSTATAADESITHSTLLEEAGVTLALGSTAAAAPLAGGDTTFDTGAVSGPAIVSRGGGYYERHEARTYPQTSTIGKYGRGGQGGKSRWVTPFGGGNAGTAGANGEDGAILLFW